jgi:hypothetical protein
LQIPGTLLCSSITAYFDGHFNNTNRFVPREFKRTIPVQFQVRMLADEKNRDMITKIDHWNETLMSSDQFGMNSYDSPLCKLGQTCKHTIMLLGTEFLLSSAKKLEAKREFFYTPDCYRI